MVFRGLLFCIIGAWPLAAQTVSLRNVSYPGTAVEVGDTIQVAISGAAPYGAVTVVENGGSPFYFGTTDGSGNWSVTATETASYVGSYVQYWYVNGVALTPNNLNSTYFPYAATFPSFNVYANYSGSNCSSQSTVVTNTCGGPSGQAHHWNWTPVTYQNSSSLSSTTVSGAVGVWNSFQSKLSLSSDISVRQDIIIYNDSGQAGTAYGVTYTWGGACSPCYGYTNLCNNSCFNAAAVYHAEIYMNLSTIATGAGYLGLSTDEFQRRVLVHELGHGAMRMADISPIHGACSEVQSIMYGSGSVLAGCGTSGPVSSCDTSTVNSVYPTAPGYCASSTSNYCYFGYYSCS